MRAWLNSGGGPAAALPLLLLALALRMLVPAGWMPAADGRGIELCTGMGVVKAWVDADGRIHRDAPAPEKPDQPCTFAGLSAPLLAGAGPVQLAAIPAMAAHLGERPLLVRVGQGLAAPPPPATGPPATF